MTKTLRILNIWLVLLVLCCCNAQKQNSGMAKSPCGVDINDNSCFYANGQGISNNVNIARQKAVLIARERIASEISVMITNSSSIYEESIEQNGYTKEKFISETKSLVQQTLVGSTVSCEETTTTADGSYMVSVIVTMPKTNMTAVIDNSVKQFIGSGTSDVDINIPMSAISNEKTFVALIANEHYKQEEDVPFASNDGEIVYKYFTQTLGIPENHIKFAKDASLNEMRYALNWLRQIADAYDGEAKVIVYYAGHGIPDEASGTSYLLPSDGYGTDVTSGYKVSDLYATLGAMPLKSAVVFMDACFSGAKRDGKMMASARGVAIKAKNNIPSGNVVVLSAAQGDETAYANNKAQHGMFTYYLLKKLQESKGDVSIDELSSYIISNVRKESIVENGKSQTPCVLASPTVADVWRTWKLK